MKPAGKARAGKAGERVAAEERVALEEWSGPVSPRYQYKTRIVVTGAAKGATLSYDHEGVYSEGKPTEARKATCAVPAEAYAALWAGLEGGGVFSLGDAALPDETRARVGVSVNTLEASRGGRQARIEYTLAGLKRADGAKKRALVEQLKAWASQLAIAAAPAPAAQPAAPTASLATAAKATAAKATAAKATTAKATAAKKPAVGAKSTVAPEPAAAKKPATTPAKKPVSR